MASSSSGSMLLEKLKFSPSFATKQHGGKGSWLINHQCASYRQQISKYPLKELHQSFPRLLSSVFGFDGSSGWRLKYCHRTQNPVEFKNGYEFLCPYGDLFRLIDRLEENGFLYEFPIKCLPYPSQQALIEGNIPEFYHGKVQLSVETNQGVPNHIYLSAFEYYFFHFAYYLVYIQKNLSQSQLPWAPMQDCLYASLLDSYLYHFLPPVGTIPSSHSTGLDSTHQPPFSRSQVQSPPPPQGHTSLGLLTFSGYARGSGQIMGVAQSSSTTPLHQTDFSVPYTELFLQTLVEFWLNQTTSLGSSFLSHNQARTCSLEHIKLIRMMVKHVLYFTNGTTVTANPLSLSPISSAHVSVTLTLRNSVVSLFLQKPLYQFISHAFKHWSLDEAFRFVLELWLTYIQPWRYIDPTQLSSDNKEIPVPMMSKWSQYVMEHFPFYSSLLLIFFERSFQLDLTSNNGVNLLFRVSKVFAQRGVKDYIVSGERLLTQSSIGSVHAKSPSATLSDASYLKNLFEVLEGPTFQYQSLFDPLVIEAVKILCSNIQQAQAQLAANFKQPNLSYSTKKSSWLTSLWSDSTNTVSHQPIDPKKLCSLLQAAEHNLRAFFELPLVTSGSPVIPLSQSLDGSPKLHSPLSPSSSHHTYYIDNASLTTPPTSIEAQYEPNSCKLTPEGKEQVKGGIRLCNKSRVGLLGDPLLQPIRSYESVTLVRWLYGISCYLNQKFSSQLNTIGSSNRFVHKLLLQLLAPPHEVSAHEMHQLDVPGTPISRMARPLIPSEQRNPPRINLRPLGSYYTLLYISLLLLIIWVLPIPSILIIVVLILVVFTYCLVSYCITR